MVAKFQHNLRLGLKFRKAPLWHVEVQKMACRKKLTRLTSIFYCRIGQAVLTEALRDMGCVFLIVGFGAVVCERQSQGIALGVGCFGSVDWKKDGFDGVTTET